MTESYRNIMKRATQLAQGGDPAGAVAAYREAVTLAPQRPDAHYELALLHHRRGEIAEAVAAFRKVVELKPQDASAWNNLGVLYYGQSDWGLAEHAFRQAVLWNERYADAWYGLAKTLLKLDRESEAAEALRTCLRWEPGHGGARKALDALGLETSLSPVQGLRIGFVTIWFERGQAYVTKTLRDAVSGNNETFIFARTGGVYGQPKLETGGFWNVPNLTTFPQYQIPKNVLAQWIEANRLDAVIFNEEYDWNLVQAAKETGVRVLTYLDYYKEDWKPFMGLYDAVLCSTLRTFYLVRDSCNAYYVGWAVDTELFRPRDNGDEKFTFFHNAGWLGINYRKMTPAVVLAFDAISRHLPNTTLFVHAQVGLEKLPPVVAHIVHENPRITYHVETVPAPGLYHKGHILVFPSKLEGLGLPLLEGVASGLPVIATDAPPMNEFVRAGENGLLAEVAGTVNRQDNIAFPETIVDVNDLAAKMAALAQDRDRVKQMGMNARKFAEEELALDNLDRRVTHIFDELIQGSVSV
ncbi:MAG: tetratricopeptide repeat protein [Chloroflexi bacterium]|nr:tetratricopeptide repeat protein [Chloroflexota bacterium]